MASLNDILNSRVPVPVEYRGITINCEVNPEKMTAETEESFSAVTSTRDLIKLLLEFLLSWDLELDGQVIPLKEKVIAKEVPRGLITAIILQSAREMGPNGTSPAD